MRKKTDISKSGNDQESDLEKNNVSKNSEKSTETVLGLRKYIYVG